jgi:hypothetical protein
MDYTSWLRALVFLFKDVLSFFIVFVFIFLLDFPSNWLNIHDSIFNRVFDRAWKLGDDPFLTEFEEKSSRRGRRMAGNDLEQFLEK